MKLYTVGFIFDANFEQVVLITKNRPEWQKGKLNGVGGKIEAGETPPACIVREVREEIGLSTEEMDWTHTAVLAGPDWKMDVFGLIHKGKNAAVRACTDEQVDWYEVAHLPEATPSNVPWLVYLTKDILENRQIQSVAVAYHK